jgi:NAD(P)-dependent dehydrogenase (short-subunit alcohol dehydrogenase family)
MKTVVMTGGTAGFGVVAAKRISDTPNTKLILGARQNKNPSIDILPLDLARLSNVRSFVQALTTKLDGTKIDILILNAGAQFGNTKQRTEDGFESTFAINHLAHYLLLRLLTPSLAQNATVVTTTSDVHDPKLNPLGPKKLDPETLAHPNGKGNGFIPGFRAYSSSKLCDLLNARAFEASTDAQMNGMRVIAYNPGLTPDTSLYRAWPRWAKLMMASAALVRPVAGINTIEQAANAIADLALGTIVPPTGRIYASLVKGRLTWPDPSELAQSDTAMKELWVESAHMVGLPKQAEEVNLLADRTVRD